MGTKYGVFKRKLLGNQTLVFFFPVWISTLIATLMKEDSVLDHDNVYVNGYDSAYLLDDTYHPVKTDETINPTVTDAWRPGKDGLISQLS